MSESECPHAKTCPLYATFESNELTALWKTLYCSNPRRYPDCARYKLSLEGKPVPLGLLPNGSDLGK